MNKKGQHGHIVQEFVVLVAVGAGGGVEVGGTDVVAGVLVAVAGAGVVVGPVPVPSRTIPEAGPRVTEFMALP